MTVQSESMRTSKLDHELDADGVTGIGREDDEEEEEVEEVEGLLP